MYDNLYIFQYVRVCSHLYLLYADLSSQTICRISMKICTWKVVRKGLISISQSLNQKEGFPALEMITVLGGSHCHPHFDNHLHTCL